MEDNASTLYISSIKQTCGDYIDQCNIFSKQHRTQAKATKAYWDFFSVINVILVSSQALSMTILTVAKANEIDLAIVGGIFAFLIAIQSKIQSSFEFNVVSCHHHQIADDFHELSLMFFLLLSDIDKGSFHDCDYEKLVLKYISVVEKSHIPNVWESKCCKIS